VTDRISLGNATVTRVIEFEFDVGAALFAETPPEAWRNNADLLVPTFYDPEADRWRVAVQSWVIEVDGLTVVVDTGVGNDRERPHIPALSGRRTDFLGALGRAGVDPVDVDVVVNTHLHTDHVGWNTRLVDGRWVPTFPSARYLFGRVELAHWSATRDPNERQILDDSVQPIFDAGLAEQVESDHVLTAEVRLEPTPGHTPGHVSVRIVSRGHEAVITGDLMHHPIQCCEPDRSVHFDVDPQKARATRRAFLERQANRPVLVLGTHFAAPTGGWIVRDGDAWRFATEAPADT